MDTSTRRFLCGVNAVCGGLLSQSVLGEGVCVVRSCSSEVGVVRSAISSSEVWCLVPASSVTRRRSCGVYRVPAPLNADLMAAWLNWQAAICLLMNWSLWELHCPAMCVHESRSPQSGHASVGACLYLKASLPLYSWPYMNLTTVMPSLWEFRMRECSAVPTMLVLAPWVLTFVMVRRL